MRNLQKKSRILRSPGDPNVSALIQFSVFSLAKGLLRTSHEAELGPLRWNELVLYSYRERLEERR